MWARTYTIGPAGTQAYLCLDTAIDTPMWVSTERERVDTDIDVETETEIHPVGLVSPTQYPKDPAALGKQSTRSVHVLVLVAFGIKLNTKGSDKGTSLVVQWLRLCTSTAGGEGSIPGKGTKIPHDPQCSQKNRKVVMSPEESVWASKQECKGTESII